MTQGLQRHGPALSRFFSVIVPLYNKRPYVRTAVESILAQTYRDYEVIVVDDGSTDGSAVELEPLVGGRVRIIKQPNLGVSAARNTGARHAQFGYLAFLDADDQWAPEFLTRMAELIEKYRGAGIYGANHRYRYPNGVEFYDNLQGLFEESRLDGLVNDYFAAFCAHRRSVFSNSGFCIPKRVFEESGGYKEGVRMTEDSHLWCRIALQYPVAFTREVLCTYNIETPNSTINLFEPQNYAVTKMLQERLIAGEIPERFRASVRRLVGFLELSHIKRALLLSRRAFVFRRIARWSLIASYPREVVLLLLCAAAPSGFLRWLVQVRHEMCAPRSGAQTASYRRRKR